MIYPTFPQVLNVTSYAMLREIAGNLSDWLAENDIELLQQGLDVDRTTLLQRFKAEGNSVLFGTDSFWQGVDVTGEKLSNVIIVRLPFAVPDQPLLAGRLEQIREQGGNPFSDYQLPSAIIKFKQGFGRLIRSKNDTGIVVILDSRIVITSLTTSHQSVRSNPIYEEFRINCTMVNLNALFYDLRGIWRQYIA